MIQSKAKHIPQMETDTQTAWSRNITSVAQKAIPSNIYIYLIIYVCVCVRLGECLGFLGDQLRLSVSPIPSPSISPP